MLKLEQAFAAPGFQSLDLFFGSRGNLSIEYQLPAASSWCDVVLLGRHKTQPSAVVLELKDWITSGIRPGRALGLIEYQGAQKLHPSEQVRGYVEYCRHFHSTIEDFRATIDGCVLLTRDYYTKSFTESPNDVLTRDFPLFTLSPDDLQTKFPAFFSCRLTEPDKEFATAFEIGRYRQKRGFVAQIGGQILDPKSKPFELLDGQRLAFALTEAVVAETFLKNVNNPHQKRVVIIKGPPGSGKSVIAARLWASLVTNPDLPAGDVIFTSTSMSQNSNWSHLFEENAGKKGARGVVRKATGFTPIQTPDLGQLRKKHGKQFLTGGDWRANFKLIRDMGVSFRDGSFDNQHLVTIVDEAHALINTEHPEGRGQFGFVVALGPQAYHIIRTSQLSVFLLDPDQAFRLRENTTIEQVKEWAKELGAGTPEVVSLEGSQFRCAGSSEYVAWVEALLKAAPAAQNLIFSKGWQSSCSTEERNAHRYEEGGFKELPIAAESGAIVFDMFPAAKEGKHVDYTSEFDFKIFETPVAMEEALRSRHATGHSVRLLSTYSREWLTAEATNPHNLPPGMQDFCESFVYNGEGRTWSRPWNHVPNGDYSWFIMGKRGSSIAEDPLCEVGCPYAVRGFDYDYVGILWLNDLLWRTDKWIVNLDSVFETGVGNLPKQAAKQAGKAAYNELLLRVAQTYRILLTRAIKGAYVWIPDTETRDHILASQGADISPF
ncbi:MAG: DUF2075 domain-containing protein [Candidatus Sumerlaeaceae bacterium]|nr:DUF2075 domain-containing protein [Candidatus Sumerlaeaceae bacterium]